MTRDEIDRLVSEGEAIVPSSGFSESVMDAVRREALAPPIPFPWRRALPGIAALAIALVSALTVSAASAAAPIAGSDATFLRVIVNVATNPATPWLALAVLLTVAPVVWSLRLMRV